MGKTIILYVKCFNFNIDEHRRKENKGANLVGKGNMGIIRTA